MFKEPCSIHVPLNQILNMIITSFESLPSMTEVILEKLEGHGNLLQTIDPVITVLTVFAQIKCGMWKRNGIYLVEGQHHYYHDPSINAHNKANDLMLLQIACSIIPGKSHSSRKLCPKLCPKISPAVLISFQFIFQILA